jgi:hypothetical protein
MIIKNKFYSILIVVICILSIGGCRYDKPSDKKPNEKGESYLAIDNLWVDTISVLLRESLWLPRDKYDASSILMLPMSWAFEVKDTSKINDFSDFFIQVNTYYYETLAENRTNNAQFQYFISQYLILKHEYNGLSDTDIELLNKVRSWAFNFWNEPAWMWGREPFDSMYERMEWKLTELSPQRSYYRAIFDEELFLLATVANLQQINLANLISEQETSFSQINKLTWIMLSQEIKLSLETDNLNYFNFQPGVWTEHPDYAYAGQSEIIESMPKILIEGIATDSSHMHRWPVWLKSFKRMFLNDATKLNFIKKLEISLAKQFSEFVYVKSDSMFPAPRMNNFFDGRNGIYRYLYATQGGSGYEPYQLSGTLVVGWYGALLKADDFSEDINNVLENDQLPSYVITTYVGPNTTRDRHPLFSWPEYFSNGMAELNYRITYELLK